MEIKNNQKTIVKMMVFLYVEPDIRIQRVHKRAIERFGRRVLEGGDMYESHMKFLKDNRNYCIIKVQKKERDFYDDSENKFYHK